MNNALSTPASTPASAVVSIPDPGAAAIQPGSVAGQYLSFFLGDEEYAIDILAVREIRGWSKATRIPNAPPFMLGVLNLRGAVVPIIDLRLRFGVEKIDYTATTVVIVVAIGKRLFGIVVDGVSDVLDISAEEVCPVPDFGAAIDVDYLRGLTTREDHMIMLLDPARLAGGEVWDLVAHKKTPEGEAN